MIILLDWWRAECGGTRNGDSTADFLASKDGDGEVVVRVVATTSADEIINQVTPSVTDYQSMYNLEYILKNENN